MHLSGRAPSGSTRANAPVPRALGMHLQQDPRLVDTPRPSWVAQLSPDGVLERLEQLDSDAAIVAAVGAEPAVLGVDAPLAVPNAAGRRDLETVLSWLDVPVFPVSRRRAQQVFGGVRGKGLAPALRGAGIDVVEAVPDQVLRQLMWEARPTPEAPVNLADYRAAWLGLRPPAYRPKGAGRARPGGLPAVHALLAGAVDWAGWAPATDPDDWRAIADAGVVDAVACAVAVWRWIHRPERAVRLGTPERGEALLAADGNLIERLEVNLTRLRAEGAVQI
ncbi:MAG: DUF429 domain-containing protein [Thermoleophilia bacterium]